MKKQCKSALFEQMARSGLLPSYPRLRDYAVVIADIAHSAGIKLENLNDSFVSRLRDYNEKFNPPVHERSLLGVTTQLLIDHAQDRVTNINHETLFVQCSHCGMSVGYSERFRAYRCSCGAMASADRNGLIQAIPAKADIRQLRSDIHEHLDALWRTKEDRENVYRAISSKLGIPLPNCHVGYVTTPEHAQKWFNAIESIRGCSYAVL